MPTYKKIGILGLGWLGKALAEELNSSGFEVIGSTTTAEKVGDFKKNGIKAFELKIEDQHIEGSLEWLGKIDLLILNIPPKRALGEGYHPAQVKKLLEKAPHLTQIPIIYISSTSVYGEVEGFVEEKDAIAIESEDQNALLQAEKYLHASINNLAVLRCGGLTGHDRIIAPYFWKRLQAGQILEDEPINYVHQLDVVSAIKLLIENFKNGTWNLVAPKHPHKSEYTKAWAEKMGKMDEYQHLEHLWIPGKGKWVDGNLIHRELGFRYMYEEPTKFAL